MSMCAPVRKPPFAITTRQDAIVATQASAEGENDGNGGGKLWSRMYMHYRHFPPPGSDLNDVDLKHDCDIRNKTDKNYICCDIPAHSITHAKLNYDNENYKY